MSGVPPLRKGRARRVGDAARRAVIRRSLEHAIFGACVAALIVALIRLLG